MAGRDTKHLQKFCRGSRPRDAIHSELLNNGVPYSGETGKDSVTKPTLGIMILHSNHTTTTRSTVILNSSPVQGLDGEGVHHSDLYPTLCQLVSCLHSFVQSDSGTNNKDLSNLTLMFP